MLKQQLPGAKSSPKRTARFLLELITQARLAVDEVIDSIGRQTIERS
jgi:hypothetical protein